MQDMHDPKMLAKRLRSALKTRDIDLTHGAALEVVAQQLGYADWNTAAARLIPSEFEIPKGWVLSGDNPKGYDVGVDPKSPNAGATIRARDVEAKQGGFATLMQSIDAARYRGKRVRLSADLRCQNVVGAVTLWLRIDGANKGGIKFDNMERRTKDGPLQNTQDWQKRVIVLDVPEAGESIHYGFYLRGTGQCWARRFALQDVAADVAVTSEESQRMSAPMNLDFQV